MAPVTAAAYKGLLPLVAGTPGNYLWTTYDPDADVLYVHFKKPAHATDSDVTDDDVIVRYEGDEVVGLTILHASRR